MTTAIQDRELAEQKLASALHLIERLIAGEWPYQDSSDALEAIAGVFRKKLDGLRSLGDASPEIINHWCSDAREMVSRYHSFIGVILRSSNIRNAFESYAPIRELACALLSDEYKVIIGSEWNYTPFVYPIPLSPLDNFILVGLPASESQNALLTPVAGHELGHAIWRRTDIGDEVNNKIRNDVIQSFLGGGPGQSSLFPEEITKEQLEKDLRLINKWGNAYEYAKRQCEELFCDVLACWLFGDGYLHAYRYLTVPDLHPRPTPYYPTNRTRAEVIFRAAEKFHSTAAPLPEFFPQQPDQTNKDVKLADEIAKANSNFIIDKVGSYCSQRVDANKLCKSTSENIDKCESSLRRLQPVENLLTVADVITAAWRIRLDLSSWNIPGVKPAKKIDILNDLVFKSFEVNEIAAAKKNKAAMRP